jgi:DNA repair protein RecN (Recombination protein N)
MTDHTSGWVEIVGQHDQLSLTRAAELRAMVDRGLDRRGRQALEDYTSARRTLLNLEEDQALLGGDRMALARELDLVSYQAREIIAAGFSSGEDESLEASASRLRHAGEISSNLTVALEAIEQGLEGLGRAQSELRRATRLDPGLDTLSKALDSAVELVTEASRDVRRSAETALVDPEELARVETRLNLLGDLRRKYGHSLDEILDYGRRTSQRRSEISELLERAGRIDAELARAREELGAAGSSLASARSRAGRRLAAAARQHLLELGMSDPLVEVAVEEDECGPHGCDRTTIRFASDSRLQPGELARVASGGELSRLVLSFRLAAGAGDSQVLAFDEIDSGVGGATALALGRKLSGLGRGRQVLCVTHLPQVAAFASSHYVVEREGNRARVRQVDGAERQTELARMLAGLPESERGREAAAELLALAAAG